MMLAAYMQIVVTIVTAAIVQYKAYQIISKKIDSENNVQDFKIPQEA